MLSVSEIQKLIPIGMRTDDILVSKLQGGGRGGRGGKGGEGERGREDGVTPI